MTGTFLDPWQHIIRDQESEKKWKFNLETSLLASSKSPLLASVRVFVTKSCNPPPPMFKEMVQCSGGTWLKTMPTPAAAEKDGGKHQQQLLVISCAQDKAVYTKGLKSGVMSAVHDT